MMDTLLQEQLATVFRRQRRLQLAVRLALCWGALALIGLGVFLSGTRSASHSLGWIIGLAALGLVAGGIVFARQRRMQPDWHDIARRIEQHYPELNGLLLTAAQQQPAADGQLQYLQERIIRDALNHGRLNSWTETIPWSRAAAAQLAHLLALVCFVSILVALGPRSERKSVFSDGWTADGVTITPGDISLERGERLVVVASFAGSIPPSVNLITTLPTEQSKRIPLVKSLSDPVFGGSISEVTTSFVYRVEYGNEQTRDFTVNVFEYPRLERADADLTFPDYTGLEPKRVENTFRISAVEGTSCTLTLQLNKPVARAQFVVKGEVGEAIPLTIASNAPMATLTGLTLETNRTYLLQLVDAEGRTNKLPASFVVNVLKNREPELKIAAPRGDTRPSALEEVLFEGTVWDDFGVQAYGLAYTEAGGEIKFVELGQNIPANEKRPFKHLLSLEDFGAKPDQLISWFLWADDIGPDGQPRRSASDMYFAEVRPFDEVFRQGQGQAGGDQEQQQQAGGQSGGGNQQAQLAELQKQIINATWKLQRQQSRQPPAVKPAKPANSDKPSNGTSAIENREWFDVAGQFGLRRQSAAAPALLENEPGVVLKNHFPMRNPKPLTRPSATLSPSDGERDGVRGRSGISENHSNNPVPPLSESGVALRFPPQAKTPLVRSVFGQRTPGRTSDTPLSRARERLADISGTNKVASTSQFSQDLGVVRDAVAQAITQAQTARERQSSVQNAVLWDGLIRDLEKAQAALEKAEQSPALLADALAAEQSAFQALLRLQQREYEIARNRSRTQNSGNSREQQMQRQLDQLDLTREENRYETERLAQAPQSPERREQLQVMNRLGELARRQQDLNERLQELQTALQEAKSEQEREELRRQLKRLQEEEQQMLADADELQQRMNQPENQSRLSEQRQQLEQTRQEMQRAAEAAQQGSPSQALASGTRAQRQLQQMREDLRKQNSSEFAEDLKQLRAAAREAERQQQEIKKQMEQLSNGGQRKLDDSQARQQSLEQLAQQAQRLTNLVARATQLSQQTEDAEPIASRELYDTLRKFSQDDAKSVRQFQDELIERGLMRTELYRRLAEIEKQEDVKSVELTSEMLRQGFLPQAQQAGDRAGEAVGELARGIERAAEKVLGDDTEALRLARQQLDQLTDQIEREIAQGQGAGTTNNPSQDRNGQAQAGNSSNQSGNEREQQSQGEAQRGNGQRPATGPQSETGNQNQAAASGEAGQPPGESQSPAGTQTAQRGQGGNPQPGGERGEQPTEAQAGEAQPGANASAQNRRGNRGGLRGGAPRGDEANAGGLPAGLEQFLAPERRGPGGGGPVITGGDFVPWADGLREVEEMVEDPALQTQLATARERARVMRQQYRQTQEKPEWTQVQLQVLKPLVEVRNQIADELARRNSKESLVPVDRDPVPDRYSELVRRYYEELGKDK